MFKATEIQVCVSKLMMPAVSPQRRRLPTQSRGVHFIISRNHVSSFAVVLVVSQARGEVTCSVRARNDYV